MTFPPMSPEETTTPEIYGLAAAIGVEMNKLGRPLSEMEAISVAEGLVALSDGRLNPPEAR